MTTESDSDSELMYFEDRRGRQICVVSDVPRTAKSLAQYSIEVIQDGDVVDFYMIWGRESFGNWVIKNGWKERKR